MAKTKKQSAKKASMTTRDTGGYTLSSTRPIVARKTPPTVVPFQDGVRVCNTEQFLGDGLTLSNGTVKGLLTMNPADPTGFPWLHRIAQNYSKFRFRKLSMSYVPYVGTGTTGYIAMGSFYESEDAIKYNAVGTLPNLSSQPEFTVGPLYAGNAISSHDAAVNSANWLGIEFDCKRMSDNFTKWFYVDPASSVSLGTGNEARLNQTVPCYTGLQWNLSGATGSVLVGSIYVTYEVEFIQPTSNTVQ